MNLLLHPHFLEARQRLQDALEGQVCGRLIFIVGPTGTGKTTLRKAVLRQLAGKPEFWGQGRIPLIETYALLPANAYFSSKALAESLVAELHGPTLKWLTDDGESPSLAAARIQEEIERSKAALEPLVAKSRPEPRLWNMITELCAARHTRLISIEHATSLCVTRKSKAPADHILHLMSIAEKSGLSFVLTGVPSMSALWTTRPEIRRRSDLIWVPPYGVRDREDMKKFISLLRTLESHYPFERELLRKTVNLIMAATAGIFAEVSQLFSRAQRAARNDGREQISKHDLEQSVYNDAALKVMWADVLNFEELREAGSVRQLKEIQKMIPSPVKPAQ